jgi:hypothetical protein
MSWSPSFPVLPVCRFTTPIYDKIHKIGGHLIKNYSMYYKVYLVDNTYHRGGDCPAIIEELHEGNDKYLIRVWYSIYSNVIYRENPRDPGNVKINLSTGHVLSKVWRFGLIKSPKRMLMIWHKKTGQLVEYVPIYTPSSHPGPP